VELETLETIRDAGVGGGFIMAPDHSYHSAIPFDNIWMVFETTKRYGCYPLDMDSIKGRIAELKAQGAGLDWKSATSVKQESTPGARKRRPRRNR
jgi:hypothetical protein